MQFLDALINHQLGMLKNVENIGLLIFQNNCKRDHSRVGKIPYNPVVAYEMNELSGWQGLKGSAESPNPLSD